MHELCHKPQQRDTRRESGNFLITNFIKTSLPFYKTYNPPTSLDTLIREFQVYHANWNEEQDLQAPFITCLANTEQNLYFYLNDPVKLVVAVGNNRAEI